MRKTKNINTRNSLLSDVPASLSAVAKAMYIQQKAKQIGFEWEYKEDVLKKVQEELLELQEAVNAGNQKNIEDEFGDVLFSLINYARFLHVDAESALEQTNKKFISRFTQMEQLAAQQNKNLTELTLTEMDNLWNFIKKKT